MTAMAGGGEIKINPNLLKQLLKKQPQIKPGSLQVTLFKFNVPVNIKKVHKDVGKAYVGCFVSDVEGLLAQLAANHYGYGMTEIPLNNGAYNGNITVSITSMDKGDPAGVSYWGCLLLFIIGEDSFPIAPIVHGNTPEIAQYGPAPGTDTSKTYFEGTLSP